MSDTEETWKQRVASWRASGQTAEEFSAKQPWAASTLRWWASRLSLHKLDPEVYLRDVFRVLPHWPRDRYIELAPRYWRITRARLRPDELDREVGWLTVPEPPLPTMPATRPAGDELAGAPAAP